MQQVTHT